MTRQLRSRALVPLLLTAVTGAGLAAAPPAAASELQAVVSYDTTMPTVRGVDVVTALPAVGAAVVRGDAEALGRLARTAGIRGMLPDDAVELTGRPFESATATGVLASDGLAAPAGQADAGRGVRIAVVDTGVSDSPALTRASGRLVDGADTRAVDDGGPVRTSGVFTDGHGHGTFMASVAAGGAAEGSAGKPVGVAPGSTVVVVRVAEADGRTSLSQVVAGLDWVAAHPDQVDVANLSFSHSRPGSGYGADPLVDAVERVRAAGISVVVSAGNNAGEVGDPGFSPRVLSVGAADLGAGKVASFSGSAVAAGVRRPDVVASGVKVLGVLPPGSAMAQAHPEARQSSGLWRGTGTSQATAVTSGVAALLIAQHPDATPAQVKASLREAATGLPGKRDGAGLVQVAAGELATGPDGVSPEGDDLTGEIGFDGSSWSGSSWSGSSWSGSSWSGSSWSGSSWSGSSWSGSSWSGSSWSGSSWSSLGSE